MVSQHSYVQRQLKTMRPQAGGIATASNLATEATRFVSDFGRQIFLFGGLILLVTIILAATTGNQTFASMVAWTGLGSNY